MKAINFLLCFLFYSVVISSCSHQSVDSYQQLTQENIQKATAELSQTLHLSLKQEVKFYLGNNREELDNLIIHELGYGFHQKPSRRSLYAVGAKGKIAFLSPAAYKNDTDITFNQRNYYLLVKHELLHSFHFELNPQFNSCPKFLIEGFPIYFSGQWQELEEFSEPVSLGIKEKKIPNLLDVKLSERQQYEWGWSFVKYYYETQGLEKTLTLMKTCKLEKNDIQKWHAWLKNQNQELAEKLTKNPKTIYFQNDSKTLGGELFLPKGKGPFPALLYNHGSAPGMLNSEASKLIGPMFADKGWIFFMPYRRGQGLSAEAGAYIGDEISKAKKTGGEEAAVAMMVKLLSTDHLDDQMAALKWLKDQNFVQKNKIAVAGNSFGGIQAVLGAEKESYCAAVDASGGAESWEKAPELQELMKNAVKNSLSPILFFQAKNDYDLSPSKILAETMKSADKLSEIKIYPSFGKTTKEGHSFAYLGSSIWFEDVLGFLNIHCKSH